MALDNPAARLYELLSSVQVVAGPRVSRQDAWARALGTEGSVAQAIAEVAVLLVDLEKVVERADDPAVTKMYEHYAPEWRGAVLSPNHAWNTGSESLVDQGALASLGVLASLLSVRGSEGVVPESGALAGLREALEAALDEVRADTSLQKEVQGLLVARLHDMLWALDHVRVFGPEGVKAAAERLAGVVAFSPEVRENGGIVRRTMGIVRRVWVAFTFAGQATDAIEGWDEVIGMLPPP